LTQKTGILGGTFDPVHKGHLAIAEAAGNLCNLSEVILIPAAVPPHKQNKRISAYSHRIAMLKAAVGKHPVCHVSGIEQLLPSPSFTIDTLEYLQLHSVAKMEIYFIIGADAFLDIRSWKKYSDVLKSCHFIVFTRSGHKTSVLHSLFRKLGYKPNDTVWYHQENKRKIFTAEHALPALSSSDIRKRISMGKSVEGLITKGVSEFIAKHSLYQA